MSLQTLIQDAEAQQHRIGNALIVLDGLDRNRHCGVRIELEPSTGSEGCWWATVRDGIGYGSSAYANSKLQAVTDALDEYLDLLNGSRAAATGGVYSRRA